MTQITGTATLTVDHEHTATAIGSGDVPALATPWMIALFERATLAALRSVTGPSETTVGVAVDIQHLAAAPIGSTIEAVATLSDDAEHGLVFEVTAREDDRVIGRGEITRVRVDRSRFVEGLT